MFHKIKNKIGIKFSLKSKLIIGFVIIFVLVSAVITHTTKKLSEVEKLGSELIEKYQTMAISSEKLSGLINLNTSLFSEFLLTGDQEFIIKFNKNYKKSMLEYKKLRAIDTFVNRFNDIDLKRIKFLLLKLRTRTNKVYTIRINPLKNNRGLSEATKVLNPINNLFVSKIAHFIQTIDAEYDGDDKNEILRTLYNIRNTWNQVIISLRLYFTVRAQIILANYKVYIEQNTILIKKLSLKREVVLDKLLIDFNEVSDLQRKYIGNLPAIINIFNSGKWRNDVNVYKREVIPIVLELRSLLHLISEINSQKASQKAGIFLDTIKYVRRYNTLFIAAGTTCVFILVFIILIRIVSKIHKLSVAVKRVTLGDRHVQLDSTGSDEIDKLSIDFNTMVRQLKKSEILAEGQRMALKNLNENLGNEVAKRTHELESAQDVFIQNEKLVSIGQLSAGIAHEINNPVSFVLSNYEYLSEYINNFKHIILLYERIEIEIDSRDKLLLEIEKYKKEIDLDYIMEDIDKLLPGSLEGINRIKKIVKDMQYFSHMNNDKQEMTDLNVGIEATLTIISGQFKNRVKLTKKLGVLPKVKCTASHINQVVMNLLMNASHAIADGGEIKISTHQLDDEKVIITVSDNGHGIPENIRNKLFDPFFTTKKIGQGTGLGLSLSFGIVKKHGGNILVESEVNIGTTFTVILPIDGMDDNEASDQLKNIA